MKYIEVLNDGGLMLVDASHIVAVGIRHERVGGVQRHVCVSLAHDANGFVIQSEALGHAEALVRVGEIINTLESAGRHFIQVAGPEWVDPERVCTLSVKHSGGGSHAAAAVVSVGLDRVGNGRVIKHTFTGPDADSSATRWLDRMSEVTEGSQA